MARMKGPPIRIPGPDYELPSQTPAQEAAAEETNARFAAWWAERKATGQAMQVAFQRSYAALEGWNGVPSQEAWQALLDQTAEDWQSGAQLMTMLGGARFIGPERAALCLLLWRQFLAEYQAEGPAEYMVVAMAVLSFDHFLRVNALVHNIQARVESEVFGLPSLRTVNERDPERRVVKGLTAAQLVEELGHDLLPLLDRLNRLVIRNLRALRELKGGPLAVTVANYGQVNVGQTQTNQVRPSPNDAGEGQLSPSRKQRSTRARVSH